MIRISFAEDAGQDLEEIYAYIAEDNIAAADRHRERLRQRWEQLKHQPRLGRARDDVKPGYRCLVEGDYLIFYQCVSTEEVMIMRILHGKRDLRDALKD